MFGRIRVDEWLLSWSDELVSLKDNTMRLNDNVVNIWEFEVLQCATGNHLEIDVFALEQFEDLWDLESEILWIKALFDCLLCIMNHL